MEYNVGFQTLVSTCLHGSCKGQFVIIAVMQCGVFKPICFDSFSSVQRLDLSSRSTATSAFRCPVAACEHKQGEDWEDKENSGNFGLILNVSVPQPKSFEKASLPFEMDHWVTTSLALDRFHRNRLFSEFLLCLCFKTSLRAFFS